MGRRIRRDDSWRKARRGNDSPDTVRRIAARRLPTHNSADNVRLIAIDRVGLDSENEKQRMSGATLDQLALEEIVKRIVEVARPEKIILFGSAARGEMGPNSDLDLLIVKDGEHRRRLAGQIYDNLRGVGAAVDVVVVTPGDIERYRDSHALVIKPALREGRVIYEAA